MLCWVASNPHKNGMFGRHSKMFQLHDWSVFISTPWGLLFAINVKKIISILYFCPPTHTFCERRTAFCFWLSLGYITGRYSTCLISKKISIQISEILKHREKPDNQSTKLYLHEIVKLGEHSEHEHQQRNIPPESFINISNEQSFPEQYRVCKTKKKTWNGSYQDWSKCTWGYRTTTGWIG